jgi:hypothetical protein
MSFNIAAELVNSKLSSSTNSTVNRWASDDPTVCSASADRQPCFDAWFGHFIEPVDAASRAIAARHPVSEATPFAGRIGDPSKFLDPVQSLCKIRCRSYDHKGGHGVGHRLL